MVYKSTRCKVCFTLDVENVAYRTTTIFEWNLIASEISTRHGMTNGSTKIRFKFQIKR